jgi:hypothetical protein
MRLPWSRAESAEPHNHDNGATVTFRLNARLQPMHRGEAFEDPLDELLAKRGIGEVEGGGTQMSDHGEVECCDIVVFVHDPVAENAAAIATMLEELGAPLGSRYRADGSDESVAFGESEGLALYLNGTDLPEETYATQDVNELIERLDEAIGYTGQMMSHWEGPTETALYFYGDPYDVMADALAPVIARHPLAQRSRVERIA